MTRILARPTVGIAMFLVAASGFGSSTASAAEPRSAAENVLVSSDGSAWGPDASGTFEHIGRLVPGDSALGTFWVKNAAPTPAAMRISVRELETPSEEYARNVWLAVRDPATRVATSTNLAALSDCGIIVEADEVASDGVVRIDLRIDMGDFDGMTAQNTTVRFDFVVAMKDSAAGRFPPSACDDVGASVSSSPARPGTRDSIAMTGVEAPTHLFIGGGIVIGVGLFLVGAHRRRVDEP